MCPTFFKVNVGHTIPFKRFFWHNMAPSNSINQWSFAKKRDRRQFANFLDTNHKFSADIELIEIDT